VGVNTLKQSTAFTKIRANSKLFNTNIVTNADQFALKYNKINELAFNENTFIDSNVYGNVRQHNLTSKQATSNILSTFLNEQDMALYLKTGNKLNTAENVNESSRINSIMNSENFVSTRKYVNTLSGSLEQIENMNNSSDKKHSNYVLNDLISKQSFTNNALTNSQLVNNLSNLPVSNVATVLQNNYFNNSISNVKTLLKGDQLLRC